MSTYHESLRFYTKGDCDMVDITSRVEAVLQKSALTTGVCTIFCTGSTGSVTTIEYEDGLLKDFPEAMERIAPKGAEYKHDLRWRDGNGHSHVRASIVGPSLTIPFVNRQLAIGTWQQVVFIDYDNRPRDRSLEIVIIGE
ncbi:MAG: secondary thiamine-phosphate synthase enzyme YjbQ [Candidatus Thorarchaeota archaeon]|nr:secondary thiamine-phosphate synthase enzyme YjbQ [Candidatus Thorarchaeota archaeon]